MSNEDMAQTNLREPNKVDWENYGKSGYQRPPEAFGPDGKAIVYQGVVQDMKEVANQFAVDAEGNAYLNFRFDPIKVINTGNGSDGYLIRFTEASTKPFEKGGQPIKGNPNKLANFLRSAGLQAKPQTNSEYRAAVKAVAQRPIRFVGDWEAKNTETGETVKGYLNFPDDPERPGHKKAILKAGDVVTERDAKGNIIGTRTIKSDVLFANFRLRFFKDAAQKG